MRTTRIKKAQRGMALLAAAFALGLGLGVVRADAQDDSTGRFSFEIFGGIQGFDPRDLNLRAESDTIVQLFQFDSFLDYRLNQGYIENWQRSQGGTRGRIEIGIPAGFRLKCRVAGSLSISLGLSYFRGGRSSDLLFEYDSIDTLGFQNKEFLTYAPYSLSLSAWMPRLGLHYEHRLGAKWSLEGMIAGGPIFASCRTQSVLNYSWHVVGQDYDWPTFSQDVSLEEEGTGTALGLEAAARLNFRLAARWGLFLSAGYAYQKIGSISGEGTEIRDGITRTWEGAWAIKRDLMAAPWGELPIDYPTADWPAGSSGQRVRDFVLDLSGFQLTLGAVYRF